MRPPHLVARALARLGVIALLVATACSGGGAPRAQAPPSPTPTPTATVAFSLSSPLVRAGRAYPRRYTCREDDLSPSLTWEGVPERAVELAVVLDDPDAGDFVHWGMWGISPERASLAEDEVPAGAHQVFNDNGQADYSGPCFPDRTGHRYRVTLYALSVPLPLRPGATVPQLRAALRGRTIATATLEAKGYVFR